ncbi:MAG: BamA/TamA family outer membrane protein, partial [Gemmatimonadota bacterium]|nr:BamA/TamA family outer membrane protein [Gemmatimonadota bacterium]
TSRGQLDSLALALGRARIARPMSAVPERRIGALATPGLDPSHARLVRRRLGLSLPRDLTATDLGDAMDRLYASGDFDRVAYVLEPMGDTTTQVIVRTGKEGVSTFGFGVRYEGIYKASLLFTTTLRDRLGAGSETMLDLRLGQQLRATGSYGRRFGTLTPWAFRLRAGYERVPVDLYTDGVRTEAGRFHLWGASAFAGLATGTAGLVGVVVRGEHAINSITTGVPGDSVREDTETFYTVGGSLVVDTRDAPALPRGGVLVRGTATWADHRIGSGATFYQHVLRAQAAIPAGPVVSLLLRAEVGTSGGSDLPPHYRFFLGGSVPYFMLPDRHLPFLGLRLQERSGRHVQVAGAGLQARLPANVFVQLLWNAGTTLETWTFEPGDWMHGVGAALAWKTPFGILGGSVAGEAFGGPYRLELDLGFPF